MIVYTAMGDSITHGLGATCPAQAYPQRIAGMLRSRHRHACSQVVANSGWTSTDLLHALLDLDPIQLRNSTATSVWVGGDNLVLAGLSMLSGADKRMIPDMLSRYQRDLTVMIKTIRRVSRTTIVLCTQYNPFPKSAIAAEAIAALNGVTMQAARHHHVILAPAHRWFEGRQPQLIAGYRSGRLEDAQGRSLPVHPNDLGHQVIAQGLMPFMMNQ
ncbi:SGNH/GDSL hydrolase family protein [Cohnella nanjingensis]|uniref:SGNH/GDSL hydrolase family protein n=1 Tax=Cohnella nanjingensis TaxID=1387779 RepID=A0A7X0RRI4_9BACL|nr:SGNH/GDSL hydrolase family protein [Cohnella nanjingensis]MBB6672215.1 SGNH/GDSL hydrolase family protein [Cohnella nanjingensis]